MLGGFIEIFGESVRIQRVEKKAAIAARPKWADHLFGKKLWPFGGGLVNDFRVPVAIASHFPGGGNGRVVGPAGLDFGDGNISVEFTVGFGIMLGIMVVIRLNDNNIESAKFVECYLFAVIEGNRGCSVG